MTRLFQPGVLLRRLSLSLCTILVGSCGGGDVPSVTTPAINAAVSEAPAVNLAKAGTSTQILVLSNRADLIPAAMRSCKSPSVLATTVRSPRSTSTAAT